MSARIALLIVWGLFAPCAAAAALSIAPLATAMRSPDLLLPETDPRLHAARAAVSEMLLNQPGTKELAGFHQRLARLAQHRDTRVGRLFYAALDALPGIENLPDDATEAAVEAYFPLALGSGVRVRAGWRKTAQAFKVSEVSVNITGNAAALLTAAAPYFGTGEPMVPLLDALELDYLLGRDPADRMKPDAEKPAFDFDAALRGRFEVKAGEAAALLKTLAEQMRADSKHEAKLAALMKHLADEAGRNELARQAANPALWARVAAQAEALGRGAIPAGAPVFRGASVSVSTGAKAEWAVRRLEGGELAFSGTGLGAGNETGE